jgi:hypothetical protein
MFVAIDTIRETAVTGPEVETKTHPEPLKADGGAPYRCLCCGESLTYKTSSPRGQFEYFVHKQGTDACINDDGMSRPHRLGEEVTAKTLFNELPTDGELMQIDLERRIGVAEDFVIADVRVNAPIRLAVEVVYLSSELDLRRRLRTLFRQGYAAMIIVVTNGKLSQTQIERHLGKVGTVRVGRFDPQTLTLQFGSIVTPNQIDLETSVWNTVPAYLS